VKSKARRDDKDSLPVDAISPNTQPKYVEATATVLSGGIHKESAGHASGNNGGLSSAHQANDSTALPALDDGADDAVPTPHSLVNTAKLVQNLSQSELRLGMQSREFGSVDIRTSVARHVFSAQISVEHSDVARNLASDLPALMDRLADQQVLVGNIQVHNSGLSTSSGLAQDAQAQGGKPQVASFVGKSDAEAIHPAVIESISAGGRLDIRV
jgi:flagellar hook-length control protein FliK